MYISRGKEARYLHTLCLLGGRIRDGQSGGDVFRPNLRPSSDAPSWVVVRAMVYRRANIMIRPPTARQPPFPTPPPPPPAQMHRRDVAGRGDHRRHRTIVGRRADGRFYRRVATTPRL